MIRHYCDGCGEEIVRSYAAVPYQPTLEILHPEHGFVQRRITLKVQAAVDGVWNDGDLCFGCLQRAFLEGVDVTTPTRADRSTPARTEGV
jgi:hypothetical protein